MLIPILNNYYENLITLLEHETDESYSVAYYNITQSGDQLAQSSKGIYPLDKLKDLENKVAYLNGPIGTMPMPQIEKIKLLSASLIKNLNEITLAQFTALDASDQENWLKQPGALEYVKGLIATHDHTKEMNSLGDRLIHLFCRCRKPILRDLAIDCIQSGASSNQTNKAGYYPLHLLLDQLGGADDSFRQLITYGANPFLTEGNIRTPYEHALLCGAWKPALELAHELAKKGSLNLSHILPMISHSKMACCYKSSPNETVRLLESLKITQSDDHWIATLWSKLRQSYEKDGGNSLLKAVALWLMDQNTTKQALTEDQFFSLGTLLERYLYLPEDDSHCVFSKLEPYLDELVLSNPRLISTLDTYTTPANENIKSRLLLYPVNGWYKDLIRISLIAFGRYATTFEEFERIPEMVSLHAKILQSDFPYKENFSKVMQPILDQKRQFLADLDQQLAFLESNALPFDGYHDKLEHYIIFKRRWDLLVPKTGIRLNMGVTSGMTYHLFLDKLPILDWDNRTSPGSLLSTKLIFKAIMEMDHPEMIITQLQNWAQCVIPRYLLFYIDQNYLTSTIIHHITSMSIGDQLLLPSGSKGHATALLVTKTGSKSYQLTHYNTGTGTSSYHYEGASGNYQTFVVIEDVPEENLLDSNNWKAFSKYMSGDIHALYHTVYNLLGKGGHRSPPSKHNEDYEARQNEGSCSTQFLMAVLRHQIMQFAIGSQEEKLAVYKLVKSQMLLSFHDHHLSDIDLKTQEYAQLSLKKHQATLTLYEQAKNQDSFADALNDLSLLQNKVLGKAINLNMEPFNTTYARFAILRSISNLIAKQMILESKVTPEELGNPHFVLVKAKFARYQQNLHLWERRLKTDDPVRLIEELFRAIQSSSNEIILQRITQYIGHEQPWEMSGQISIAGSLLKTVSQYKEALWLRTFVQKLPDILERDGKCELANWCRSYWQQISNDEAA